MKKYDLWQYCEYRGTWEKYNNEPGELEFIELLLTCRFIIGTEEGFEASMFKIAEHGDTAWQDWTPTRSDTKTH